MSTAAQYAPRRVEVILVSASRSQESPLLLPLPAVVGVARRGAGPACSPGYLEVVPEGVADLVADGLGPARVAGMQGEDHEGAAAVPLDRHLGDVVVVPLLGVQEVGGVSAHAVAEPEYDLHLGSTLRVAVAHERSTDHVLTTGRGALRPVALAHAIVLTLS